MAYTIKTILSFDKDFKRLFKRYQSLPADLKKFVSDLQRNPLLGTDLGGGVHKVRMAIKSKGRGKSGGARVITYVDVIVEIEEGTVVLLALYDKSDRETISDAEIRDLMAEVGLWIEITPRCLKL